MLLEDVANRIETIVGGLIPRGTPPESPLWAAHDNLMKLLVEVDEALEAECDEDDDEGCPYAHCPGDCTEVGCLREKCDGPALAIAAVNVLARMLPPGTAMGATFSLTTPGGSCD